MKIKLNKDWTTPEDLCMGDKIPTDEKIGMIFPVFNLSTSTEYVCKQINDTEAEVTNSMRMKSIAEVNSTTVVGEGTHKFQDFMP